MRGGPFEPLQSRDSRAKFQASPALAGEVGVTRDQPC
jgi:hypothetical protein